MAKMWWLIGAARWAIACLVLAIESSGIMLATDFTCRCQPALDNKLSSIDRPSRRDDTVICWLAKILGLGDSWFIRQFSGKIWRIQHQHNSSRNKGWCTVSPYHHRATSMAKSSCPTLVHAQALSDWADYWWFGNWAGLDEFGWPIC